MNEWLETLQQFHFLRPWWLAAMLPALLLFALLWRKSAHAGEWKRAIAPHLLAHLIQGSQTRDSKTPLVLLLAAWLLACVALAGPTWQQLPAAMKKKVDARVIVLDLTLSMLSGDTPPSRLIRAKHKLSDILARSKEGLTGLVVFAGSAHVVSPLTDDSNTILSLANSLSPEIMPVAGSEPLAAIQEAAEVLKSGGMPEGQILFIGDDLPENFAEVLAPLKDQIILSVLAVGTTEGAPVAVEGGHYLKDSSGSIVLAPVNHERLRAAAQQFGGRYTPMTADDSDINLLLADFLNLDDDVRESQREFDIWEDMGAWIALLILPIAALAYRRGWLAALLLPLMTFVTLGSATPASADTWDNLWNNGDQRGKQAFDTQNWDGAAQAFNSSDWKAAALYKAGKYAEAEALYEKLPGADAHYNRGNALARQGKLDDAIQAYDEALKLAPDMKDAAANKEAVEKVRKQQQQSSQDENSQHGKNGKQEQKDQQSSSDQQQDGKNNASGQGSDSQDMPEPDKDSKQEPQKNSSGDKSEDKGESQDKTDTAESKQEEGDESDAASRQAQQEKTDQNEGKTPQGMSEVDPMTEDEQAMEQWLRRVPDDPGGLLRRKFYYESRLRRNQENQSGTQW